MGEAKRKRAAAFSEHERYVHKSSVVLQREGKKIRAFLVRKAVAQLKQSREQLAKATATVEELSTASADDKKRKRAQGNATRLTHQVKRLETEHAALKTLDLKAVVAAAFERTALKPQGKDTDDSSDDDDGDDAGDAYARGNNGDEDDGFNSEDYDDGPREADSDGDDASSDEEEQAKDGESDEDDAASDGDADEQGESVSYQPTLEADKPPVDAQLQAQLVERVLDHNQMKPCLDAIRQYVEKKQRDDAKKKRQREKAAIKKAQASLIGGRRSSAPTSMFFGSLAGGADDDIDDGVDGFSSRGPSMAGADDDIAEFLGETKKKKNRPGQMARRQKAIRMEEAREHGGAVSGYKRRFQDARDGGVSKYGPSERPKKQTKSVIPRSSDRPPRRQAPPASAPPPRREPATVVVNKPVRTAPPQRKAEAAPSHPSWLAKQALKDKEKASIHAFAGKKMTFDD